MTMMRNQHQRSRLRSAIYALAADLSAMVTALDDMDEWSNPHSAISECRGLLRLATYTKPNAEVFIEILNEMLLEEGTI